MRPRPTAYSRSTTPPVLATREVTDVPQANQGHGPRETVGPTREALPKLTKEGGDHLVLEGVDFVEEDHGGAGRGSIPEVPLPSGNLLPLATRTRPARR